MALSFTFKLIFLSVQEFWKELGEMGLHGITVSGKMEEKGAGDCVFWQDVK